MPGKLVLKRKPVTVTNSLAPVDVPRRLMRREGEMYVLSTGQVFKASQITPSYIYQLKKKNAYFKGTLIKQKNLIFRKPVVIEINDQNGKRDDRVTAKAKKRFMSGGFNVWNAMRQAFDDAFCYGISVWNPYIEWQSTKDGMEYYPVELRHLPTRTFESVGMIPSRNKQSSTVKENSSTLFGGIVFNKTTRELEFYQTYDDETTQVKNVVYVKDPSSEDFGGEPLAFPIIPLIEMLKYVWKGNMQSANRMGAPIGFITITQPKEGDATSDGMSDEDYAAKVLENWGKDTMFVLRENMTITFPNISEGNINNQIIDALEKQIIDYFSPASSISGGGALFGGSNGPELDLVNAYINGIHDWLESAFQPLVQEWLTVNRYDGYTAVVTIPEPEADLTTQNIQKALTGHNTQSLTTNEKRALLDEEELDEEGLKKLKEEYAQPASSGIPGFSYQPGELKELQSKGVMTQTANTFRNERVTGGYGGSDAGLLASQETNSKWTLGGKEPVAWFTTETGNHIPMYKDDTKKTAIERQYGKGSAKMFIPERDHKGKSKRPVPHLSDEDYKKSKLKRVHHGESDRDLLITTGSDSNRSLLQEFLGEKESWKNPTAWKIAEEAIRISSEKSDIIAAIEGDQLLGVVTTNFVGESKEVLVIEFLASNGQYKHVGTDLLKKAIRTNPGKAVFLRALPTASSYYKKIGMKVMALDEDDAGGAMIPYYFEPQDAEKFANKNMENFANVLESDDDEPMAAYAKLSSDQIKRIVEIIFEGQPIKQKNTVQDDIADMFNEEQPAGAYQTLVEGMDKDIKSLADEILEAIKKK